MSIDRLALVGANHHTAPQDFRERLQACFPIFQMPVAVLATCNRVEFYLWREGRDSLAVLLSRLGTVLREPEDVLAAHIYVRIGFDAAHHLMRVAGGLDSLVLGEDQILGQVRAAGEQIQAQKHASAGVRELAELFRRAVTAGRRIRAGRRFARHTSLAEAGIRWLAERFEGRLQQATATVVGAGQMARSAVATLTDLGVSHLILLNRRPEHAEAIRIQLSPNIVAESHPLQALDAVLPRTDLVVCATRSPQPVIAREHLAAIRSKDGARELVFLDLAVPRDVDPAVRDLPGVALIDLDDLAGVLGNGCTTDQGALAQAEELARESAKAYEEWLRIRDAAPSIVALRARGTALLQAEQARLQRLLPNLNPNERELVEQAFRRLTNRLLHAPTIALRRAAAMDKLAEITALLDLDPSEGLTAQESTRRKERNDALPN